MQLCFTSRCKPVLGALVYVTHFLHMSVHTWKKYSALRPQTSKSFKHVLKFSRGIIPLTLMDLHTCLSDLNVHRFRVVLFGVYSLVAVNTNTSFTFSPACPLFLLENTFVGTGNYLFFRTTSVRNERLHLPCFRL